jgi:hypothetical protein
MNLSVYIYIYIYICTYMYIYTHTYIHTTIHELRSRVDAQLWQHSITESDRQKDIYPDRQTHRQKQLSTALKYTGRQTDR